MSFKCLKQAAVQIDSGNTGTITKIADDFFIAVSICVMVALLIMLIVRISLWLNASKKEINYLNMEIRRSNGLEQKRWKKQKRRLLLSFFLFYRR